MLRNPSRWTSVPTSPRNYVGVFANAGATSATGFTRRIRVATYAFLFRPLRLPRPDQPAIWRVRRSRAAPLCNISIQFAPTAIGTGQVPDAITLLPAANTLGSLSLVGATRWQLTATTTTAITGNTAGLCTQRRRDYVYRHRDPERGYAFGSCRGIIDGGAGGQLSTDCRDEFHGDRDGAGFGVDGDSAHDIRCVCGGPRELRLRHRRQRASRSHRPGRRLAGHRLRRRSSSAQRSAPRCSTRRQLSPASSWTRQLRRRSAGPGFLLGELPADRHLCASVTFIRRICRLHRQHRFRRQLYGHQGQHNGSVGATQMVVAADGTGTLQASRRR